VLPSVCLYVLRGIKGSDIASVCVFISLDISKNNLLVTLLRETLHPGIMKLMTSVYDR